MANTFNHSTFLAHRAHQIAANGPRSEPKAYALPGARLAIPAELLKDHKKRGLSAEQILENLNRSYHRIYAARIAERNGWLEGPYRAAMGAKHEAAQQAAAQALREAEALRRLARNA